jgi:hypothetical protein
MFGLSRSDGGFPHRRLGRLRRLTLAVFAAAVLATSMAASAFAADRGIVGPASAYPSYCAIDRGMYTKGVYASVPKVAASNRTYGVGNDKQLVKYWTRIVDLYGNEVSPWRFDGEAWANDNKLAPLPAAYAGTNAYQNVRWAPYTRKVRVEYWINWYDANLKYLGTAQTTQLQYEVSIAGAGLSAGTIVSDAC